MPEVGKKQTAHFRIIKTNIDQFAVFEENYTNLDGVFDIKSKVLFQFDQAHSVLKCSCGVDCLKDNLIVVKAAITFEYELSEDTINGLIEGDKIKFPKDLLVFFSTNAYGALRGVIMAKLESTAIRLILPVVDLSGFIKTSMILPYSDNRH